MKLQSGQQISFKLGDVHMPQVGEVIARMTGEVELHGEITLLSDSGQQRAAFAVVQVPGVMVPLIVPTACLKLSTRVSQSVAASRINVVQAAATEKV